MKIIVGPWKDDWKQIAWNVKDKLWLGFTFSKIKDDEIKRLVEKSIVWTNDFPSLCKTKKKQSSLNNKSKEHPVPQAWRKTTTNNRLTKIIVGPKDDWQQVAWNVKDKLWLGFTFSKIKDDEIKRLVKKSIVWTNDFPQVYAKQKKSKVA